MRIAARLLASVLLLTLSLPMAIVRADIGDAIAITGVSGAETAGVADSLTVTGMSGGSVDTNYTGTVTLTSSDSAALIPAPYLFVSGDNGVHTFSVTFKTAGPQSVTATDDATNSDSANTTVSAGPASTVDASGTSMASLTSGASRDIVATVTDAFGNPVIGDSVDFGQTAGSGSVTGLTTKITDSSGTATDTVIGSHAGGVTITANDGTPKDTAIFTVAHGSVVSVSLSPSSSSISPGGSQPYTTTASDAASNTWDETGTAVLSISPNGSCDSTTCTATTGGSHTVQTSYLGKTDTSSLTVGDTPPTAIADSTTVPENAGSTAIDVLANDLDPNGEGLTVTGVSNPPHGSATVDGDNGGVHYTPDANYHGSDSFTYNIDDGNGGTAIGNVTVTVTAVNQVPSFTSGADDSTLEDSGAQDLSGWATAISQGAGDSGQVLSFIVTNTNNPLFSVQPAVNPVSGDLTYTPAANANGTAVVSVKLHDNGGTANGGVDTSAVQTMNITVTPVNDVPSFTKGANQAPNENTGLHTVAGWATAISAGPANESTQTVNFVVTNDNNSLFSVQPAVAANGTLTYTLASNITDNATVSVKIHDNGGTSNGGVDTSAIQTFTITVNGVNQVPSFNGGGNDSTLEDSGPQTLPAWATSISQGVGDSGQVLNFIVTNDNNPLFSVQPVVDASTGNLTYTPAANANGTTTVSVKLHDNGGTANGGVDTSAVQTMTISVTAVNDAPTWAKGPDETVLENSGVKTVAGWASAFSPGPANESGQNLSIGTTNDNNGLFSAQPNVTLAGTLTFTPAANASGTATVSVTLSDDGGTANGGVDHTTKTFVITVTGVNQAPSFTAGADDITLEDSGPQTMSHWATGISEGAGDTGQNLDFIVTNTNNPLFSVQPNVDPSTGTLTYTPAPNANGAAIVTVKLHDDGGTANGGNDTSAGQTMSITVTAVNDPPTFSDPADQTVLEDAGAQIVVGLAAPVSPGPANESTQTLLFNVTNNNNALFSVQPALNTSTGTLTYTPAANANGSALVTATLTDNGGTANGGDNNLTHTFTISVTPVNDAPTFVKGADQTLHEEGTTAGDGPVVTQTVVGWATGFNPGPPDESGQTIVGYNVVSNDHPLLFSVQPSIANDGTLTYKLAANRNGVAHIGITVQDSGGKANGGVDTSPGQTLTITVTGSDHPPAASNDTPTIVQGSGPTTVDVLANDNDPDGDSLTIVGISQGSRGHVAIAADRKSLTYDPTGTFIGTDLFTYSVSDGRGGTAVGTVLVTVVKDTVAPIATAPVAWITTAAVGTSASVVITFNGTDVGLGIKYFQLSESRNNGAWVATPVVVGAHSIVRVDAIGSLYQYRVRAVDLNGNIGPWAYLANFTPTLVQESAATYTGTWIGSHPSYALGKRLVYTTTNRAVATFFCTCSSISVISPKASNLGSAWVYIDGNRLATVSEHSTTTLGPQVLFARTWSTIGPHRIDIVNIGVRIDVDAFLTLQ